MATKSYSLKLEVDVNDVLRQLEQVRRELENMGENLNLSGADDGFGDLKRDFERAINQMQDELNELRISNIEMHKLDLSPVNELFELLKNINKEIDSINKGLDFSNGVEKLASNMTQIKNVYKDVMDIVNQFGGSQQNQTSLDPKKLESYLQTYKKLDKLNKIQKADTEKEQDTSLDEMRDKAIELNADYNEIKAELASLYQTNMVENKPTIKGIVELTDVLEKAENKAVELRTVLFNISDMDETFQLPHDRKNKVLLDDENGSLNTIWNDIEEYQKKSKNFQGKLKSFLQSNNIDVDNIGKTQKISGANKIVVPIEIELTKSSKDINTKLESIIKQAQEKAKSKQNLVKINIDYNKEQLKELKDFEIPIRINRQDIAELKKENLTIGIKFDDKNFQEFKDFQKTFTTDEIEKVGAATLTKIEDTAKKVTKKKPTEELPKVDASYLKNKDSYNTTKTDKAKQELKEVSNQANKSTSDLKITEATLTKLINKINILVIAIAKLDTVTPLKNLNTTFKALSDNIALTTGVEKVSNKKKNSPDDIKLLAQSYMVASQSICNSIDLIIGKLNKLDNLDNIGKIDISFDSTKLENEIKSVLNIITKLLTSDLTTGVKQSTDKMETNILSAFKTVVRELKSSDSFKEIAESFEQSTERIETSVLELILKLDSSFDVLNDSITQLDSSNAIANIGVSFETMSNKAVESIREIVTEIKTLDSSLRTGLNLTSKETIDTYWNEIEQNYNSLLTKKGNVDLRKKKNIEQVLSDYKKYKLHGGERDLNDLTKRNPKNYETLNTEYQKDSKINELKNGALSDFASEVKNLSDTISILGNDLKTFTSSNENFINQLSSLVGLLQHNFTYGGGKDNKLHFNLVSSTDPKDFVKNQAEIKSAIESMFSNNNDIASAMDLKLTKSVRREKGSLGDFERELYDFAGRYKNVMGEIVQFNGQIDSEGHLVGNMKTHILDSKEFTEEIKQLEDNKKRYEKAVNEFKELDKTFIDAQNDDNTINKISAYEKDLAPLYSQYELLQNEAEQIVEKDVTLIDESDVNRLVTINTELKEINKQISSIQKNKNYDWFNKDGQVIGQNLNIQEAKQQAILFAQSQGEMLKTLSFTEPVNGIVKFTTEIKNQADEVKKLNFVWDEVNGTLREVTKIQGTTTPFGDFQQERKTFSSLEDKVLQFFAKADSVDQTNRTEKYSKELFSITSSITELMKKGSVLESKDLTLFDESDVKELALINNEIKEQLGLLDKLISTDKFNISTKQGNLIADNIDYSDAISTTEAFIKTRGQLLKSIDVTEPVNGMAKFNAEIMTQTGAVQKLSFIWDEANHTLRETTRILGSEDTQFSQFKKKLESFDKMANAVHQLNFDDSGKIDIYKQNIDTELNEINSLINTVQTLKNKDISLFDESDLNLVNESLESLEKHLKNIDNITKDSRYDISNKQGSVIKQNLGFNEALKEVKNFANVQGKLIKDIQYTEPINGASKFTATVKTQTGEVKKLKFAWDQTSKSLRQTTEIMGNNSTGFAAFFDNIKRGFQQFGSYFTGEEIFHEIVQVVRNGIEEVKELDHAFTEMQKVSDESINNLKKFSKESFNIGKTIGSTGLDIQNSTADWMRLGYQLNDASKLAKNTALYANVGDMDIDTATEHLISSVKAFGKEFGNEVEASSAIVDKFNEIGNNFAITSADIGSSFERSAAALVAGGNSIDEALGLTTAGNLIQQNAEAVGNALKVVSLRVRGKPFFVPTTK